MAVKELFAVSQEKQMCRRWPSFIPAKTHAKFLGTLSNQGRSKILTTTHHVVSLMHREMEI